MASARAAVVLAVVVCCLLVATAPARSPVDLPPQLPDAVDPLLSKPVAVAVAGAEAVDQAAALAVREEGRPQQRSSLLCLVFRCGGEPAGAGGVVVARDSSEEQQVLDGWARPAVAGKGRKADDEEGPCDSDSDSDCDCDSDSDDEDEGGIVGWFWRLARGF